MSQRIRRVQESLASWGIDTLLVESPIDLFYLTGLHMSRGRLWIHAHQAELHVDGRYFDIVQSHSPCPVFLWERGKELQRQGTIGFDSTWTSVAGINQLRKESPHAIWVEMAQPVMELRLIKDSHEIELMREAARITWAGIEHIRSLLREGVSEQELALAFEIFVRRQGASHLAFDSIVAFGTNSAYPHHSTSNTRLQNNQVVLIDVGALFEGYCADVTRVFFFGQPDPRLQAMAELVRDADRVARQQIHTHASVGTIDRSVRDFFAKANKESLFNHSLGHGIGLEAHERPTIRWNGDDQAMHLLTGMVIAIEPGLYLPGVGGIRYENSGVITPNGFESFYPEQ